MSDDEGSPADPDDLDFTDDERVAEIDEGRYVVGTDGRPRVDRSSSEPPDDDSAFTAADPTSAAERDPTHADPGGRDERGAQGAGGDTDGAGAVGGGDAAGGGAGASDEVDRRAVNRWLASSFENDGFDYGLDATLHVEGSTTRNRMVSNDVTDTFDTLVSWFASNAGTEATPPEALGLLLVAADTPVDVPPVAIKRFAASRGLSANDTIGDLIRAAEDADGFRID